MKETRDGDPLTALNKQKKTDPKDTPAMTAPSHGQMNLNFVQRLHHISSVLKEDEKNLLNFLFTKISFFGRRLYGDGRVNFSFFFYWMHNGSLTDTKLR